MAVTIESIKLSRIQRKNRAVILEAALAVFSNHGYRGSTMDQIAEKSGLSKPNIFYYYDGKEAIYQNLLTDILMHWLAPLEAIDKDGNAIEELLSYVKKKLDFSQAHPRKSRLFANEILQGGTRISSFLEHDLKPQVEKTVSKIARWIETKQIANIDPYHLLFLIWSSTQHYADFESQIQIVTNGSNNQDKLFETALIHLETTFKKLLTPS